VALVILTIVTANAQREPSPHRPDHKHHSLADNDRKERKIGQLDNMLNLTPDQKNELRKIENRYDDRLGKNRLEHQNLKQAKRKEVLSVLTPEQRQGLAYRQTHRKSDRHPHRRG
jgi:Spy/CpxP family protein refolding chaperone